MKKLFLFLTATINIILGLVGFLGVILAYSSFTESDKGHSQADIGIIMAMAAIFIIAIPNFFLFAKSKSLEISKRKFFLLLSLGIIIGIIFFFVINLFR